MISGEDSLGPRGLTVEQQRKIAAIQSQAASNSMQSNYQRFSVDKVESSLYVGELEPEVNDDILKQHFRNAKSVHVCRDRVSGKSLGYAYVNFSRSEDCYNVLKNMNYSLINGRPCRIMMADRSATKRKVQPGNLFVKNLPPTVDDKSLHDTFAQWGNVVSCRVISSPNANKCYGYVNYDTFSAAERAIALVDGAYLFGRQIQVSHQVQKSEVAAEEPSKPRFTNVYVKNVPLHVNEDELKVLFSSLGPVSSILIQRDEYNNSKGFGFVNYENPDDAERAIYHFQDYDFGGKKLFVSKAQKKSEREDELRRQHEYQFKAAAEKPVKYQGVNLYVKNLVEQVDDDLLRREFSRFGQITSAKVMKDDRTGLSKGFGFVCFTSPEDATEAVMRMNGHKILSKEIYVALAQKKEDRRTLLEAQISQKSASSSTASSPQPVHQQLSSPQPVHQQHEQQREPALTLASLEPYSIETQRQMLGERIYALLSEIYPNDATRLTKIMIELGPVKLIQLINDPNLLKEKATVLQEALSL